MISCDFPMISYDLPMTSYVKTFSTPTLSKQLEIVDFPNLEIYKNNMFDKPLLFFFRLHDLALRRGVETWLVPGPGPGGIFFIGF